MVTLNDALNRNYYFYQGSGEVRTEFLEEVIVTLLGYKYNEFIDGKVKYWLEKGMKENEAITKAYHQGVEMSLRACDAMIKYREEIIKHFAEHPGLRGGITDERVMKMKYTQLKTLRTNLGLNRRGKKVTKQETAPKKTIEQAKESLKSKKTSETVKDVIVSTQATLEDMFPEAFRQEREPEREESFYTVAEARQAYPGYSLEELESLGIHITDEDAREKLETFSIIDEILDYDVTINGERVTEENLLTYGITDLKAILNYVRHLNKETKKQR